MSAQDLSTLLWKEREHLLLLLFKLEEEHLLLSAGRHRWLEYAALEIEQILERLRSTALARIVEASAVAAEWGLADEPTLSGLAEAAPDGPWQEILASHLSELQSLAREVDTARSARRALLGGDVRSSRDGVARGKDMRPGAADDVFDPDTGSYPAL